MPTFDSTKVTVVFVLGGPGAGKGTQCARLVDDFNFVHLSAGDLLRAEQNREGSQDGELIRTYIRAGQIVPMHITMKLLEKKMNATLKDRTTGDGWEAGCGRFLIDGFPRKMDQAVGFDEQICLSSLVIYFSTTEEIMLSRLLERAKTSGREDDNIESIKKRFRTYKTDTMPVLEHYSAQQKVAEVDGSKSVEAVYELTREVIKNLLSGKGIAKE